MRLALFLSFADMIENIPVGAIIRTLAREQQMLEEDLAFQRPVPLKEAESILNFCYFIEAVKAGSTAWAFTSPLPAEHLGFYRKTLERLVDAEELPFDATGEFNHRVFGHCLEQLHHT